MDFPRQRCWCHRCHLVGACRSCALLGENGKLATRLSVRSMHGALIADGAGTNTSTRITLFLAWTHAILLIMYVSAITVPNRPLPYGSSTEVYADRRGLSPCQCAGQPFAVRKCVR